MEDDSDFPLDPRLVKEFVWIAGERVNGLECYLSEMTVGRRFRSHFGVSPRLCAHLWTYLDDTDSLRRPPGIQKVHLLWTLDLLKGADTESKLKGRWKADEKTIRKWTTVLLDMIGDLGVVSSIERVVERSSSFGSVFFF
jgi:hypothetical protein